MKKKSAYFLTAAIVLFCGVQHAGAKNKTALHPSLLSYEKLDWKIPGGKESRIILKNGIKLYIAEDKTLPLVSMGVIFKSGSILDPKGKDGLSSLFAVLMRRGGVYGYSPEKLDDLLARYSINIGFSSNNDSLVFLADFLSEYSETALTMIEKMLFNPSFDEKILDKEKSIATEYVKYRFDNPESLLEAAYIKAMYSGSIIAGLADEKSIAAISKRDLIDHHNAVIKNGNMIIYISGNFDKKEMTERLEKIFSANMGKSNTGINFPSVAVNSPNKCFIIDKKISQSYIRMGLPFIKRPHPDYYALSIAGIILGGGGFTSRLGSAVRSDAGLTYSIYSHAESNYTYPGTFYVDFFTRNETSAKAVSLCLYEINKFLKDGITDAELESAKNMLIETLPSYFRSPGDIVSTYARSDYSGNPDNHYTSYPEKIRALTKKEVMAAAKKYITPENFIYVIVGDSAKVMNVRESDFSFADFSPVIIKPEDIMKY
ncbi:MAG TPA: pitrilysin family protein [Spirochaetota bacterium]|nr:pitrilysin family protein [Spirochaetota bacterium]HOR43325.1 pitrilysin family protein [Spirochaetota bacterium]HOU85118.1 pitrilysin family protein [Spirochaetota bacterium]HPK54926.1 pitrilysin family protein [Spirochaetota bacterium]HQE58126.1 pitrilysin family protein [Spirochaetota bacterium]